MVRLLFLLAVQIPVCEILACQSDVPQIVLDNEFRNGVDVCLEYDGTQTTLLCPFLMAIITALCLGAPMVLKELLELGDGDIA